LDAVLQGEGKVQVRNCFQDENLVAGGVIQSIEVHTTGSSIGSPESPKKFKNGNLPHRYEMTFSKNPVDQINSFWRQHITRLSFEYIPSQFIATVTVEEGKSLQISHVTFYSTNGTGARLLVGTDVTSDTLYPDIKSIVIDHSNTNTNVSSWKEVTSCTWTTSQSGPVEPILVPTELQLDSPHTYSFYLTGGGKVLITGQFVDT